MHVTERQHEGQLLLFIWIEAAGLDPFARVFIGPKQHVPAGEVAVIIVMVGILVVVDAVHLGALEKPTEPAFPRDPGHRDRLPGGLPALGQGQIQQFGDLVRIIKEQLVKIPHAEE